MKILIGTNNPGKVREFAGLLEDIPAQFVSMAEAGIENFDVDEPFDTYEGNAIHKAKAFAAKAGLYALADDSGLEVDALDGRPGVYSKRYVPGSDRDRNTKLLGELADVPDERRTARFFCALAIASPDGETVEVVRGVVEGRIQHTIDEGGHGFGYDAVFVPAGHARTFSAMPTLEKNALTHRADAVRLLTPYLRQLIARLDS